MQQELKFIIVFFFYCDSDWNWREQAQNIFFATFFLGELLCSKLDEE